MNELTNTRLYTDVCSIIEQGEVMLLIPKAAVGVDDK